MSLYHYYYDDDDDDDDDYEGQPKSPVTSDVKRKPVNVPPPIKLLQAFRIHAPTGHMHF